MRDDQYLKARLSFLWDNYFADVEQKNDIIIKFGRRAVKRLGSIKTIKNGLSKDTLILINSHFKNYEVPDFVIDATIVHELCHYAHGFGSTLPQLSPFPHRGGAVDKEMQHRGLGALLDKEQNWLDQNWFAFVGAREM